MNTGMFKGKRFLIVHFRVGKTDGVSLEIGAWKKILQSQGAEVALCSGPVSIGADYVINNLEQQLNPNIYKIDNEAFGGLKEFKSKKELKEAVLREQSVLEKEFAKVIEDYNPTNIIISNIFAVGEGIHAAGALTKVLDRYRIPTTLVNHDFYWENNRHMNPSTKFIEEQLNRYFPIEREYVKNYCINRIGQQSLLEKKGIKSDIIYDTFNYRQKCWKKRSSITKYLLEKGVVENALVVLQATRVVRRKNIEIAIDFVKELSTRKKELNGILYDGRIFDFNKDPILFVISGYVEKRDEKYLDNLLAYGKQCNVPIIYLGNDMHKRYELFDIYPYADIITYPSEYEGFGNQLLEAVFAKKQVVLFEYPVYKTDIRDKQFEFLSLGDEKEIDINSGFSKISKKKMKRVVDDAIFRLKSPEEYCKYCDMNFDIASSHFSYENTLEQFKYCFGN